MGILGAIILYLCMRESVECAYAVVLTVVETLEKIRIKEHTNENQNLLFQVNSMYQT